MASLKGLSSDMNIFLSDVPGMVRCLPSKAMIFFDKVVWYKPGSIGDMIFMKQLEQGNDMIFLTRW